MALPELELAAPRTVADACRFLAADGAAAQAIAGGTDLLMALKQGQKQPATLVDLADIDGLDGIDYSPQTGLSIGALVTLRQLARNATVRRHYPAVARAAGQVATPQIQGMATLGGNLCQDSCCMYFNRPAEVRRSLPPCHKLGGSVCHVVPTSPSCWAPYAGDMAPVLIAFGSAVTLAHEGGETTQPLADLFSDDGAQPLKLQPGQLITRVQCRAPAPCSGTVYLKVRPRATLDYPIAGVAASITLEPAAMTCSNAAVVLTGVASSPKVVEEAEALRGKTVTAENIEQVARAAIKLAYPVKNVVGSEPGYRRAMVKVNVARSLTEALRIATTALEDGK